jgi:hypothetical protein
MRGAPVIANPRSRHPVNDDGILLPEGSGPAFVEWSIGQASATGTARCVVHSRFSIDDDRARCQGGDLEPQLERFAREIMPLLTGR